MFDFHTHILPGIDDGSSSVEESIAMLEMLKEQGVEGVAATPHFYAEDTSPEDFFEKRRASWEALKPHLKPDYPEIRLGAEVLYFEGINRHDNLERFCIEGTNLLLLEMPSGVWTKRMLSAIVELNERENITVVLAHVERYMREQERSTGEFLIKCGIRLQANAEFFIARSTRRTAMKMFRDKAIHLLGTDCHNATTRKPNMAQAIEIIEHKKGIEMLQRMKARVNMFLSESSWSIKGNDGLS